jgi:hypothetical protein
VTLHSPTSRILPSSAVGRALEHSSGSKSLGRRHAVGIERSSRRRRCRWPRRRGEDVGASGTHAPFGRRMPPSLPRRFGRSPLHPSSARAWAFVVSDLGVVAAIESAVRTASRRRRALSNHGNRALVVAIRARRRSHRRRADGAPRRRGVHGHRKRRGSTKQSKPHRGDQASDDDRQNGGAGARIPSECRPRGIATAEAAGFEPARCSASLDRPRP